MKLVLILLLGIVINQVICESTTVFIGPRTIEPNGKDETDDIENPEWLENLENPLAMHSFQVRLIDPETQEELSQDEAYLHHLLISGENIRNVPCPEYEYWNFVAGAGAELTFIHIPAPFAYKINPGDEWEFALHVMNPNNITLEYTLEVTYELSNWTEEYTEVEGFLLGAGGCEDPDLDFNVPKNETADSFIIHVDYPSSVTGQFVFMGAHLHRYGKNLFLSRTSTGEVPFTANVHYDDLEHPDYITSIDSSTNRISVTMGEPLRLTGVYDCQKKHKGVMAILYGYIFVEQVYDLSNGPLPQVVEYDNPFKIPADILGSDVEQSDVEQSSVIVNSTEPVPNSSAIESSDNDDNNEETGAEEKEHKAVLGLVSSIGLILMFIVAVLLLVAVVVLFRIKHKRSLEIFD